MPVSPFLNRNSHTDPLSSRSTSPFDGEPLSTPEINCGQPPQGWKSFQKLVAEVAASQRGKVAVTEGGNSLTFSELDRLANAVAARLMELGVVRGDLVGLCAGRRVETVAGLLGILRSGAAYVPLDPAFPTERLSFMATDAGVKVVVSQSDLHGALGVSDFVFVDLDQPLPDALAEFSARETGPEDLAYVIYTSGSTGRPKGVQIPQRAVVNFSRSIARHLGMTGDDTLLAVTTFSFDMSGLDIFLPLTTGATMVLASEETRRNGRLLAAELERAGVTVMQATPGTWRMLRETGWEGCPGLKILTGAEPVPRALVNDLVGRCDSIWNLYGPTETTIWSTVMPLAADEGPVPIGRPIDNTQVYIVDSAMAQVPEGEVGELLIGGDGVALGYHQRPELTAEKFITNPFSPTPLGKLYRTGDLVRRRNAILEFVARADHQVKIRGFRIELGEIESQIEIAPGVRQAVVVVREDASGSPRLVAFVAGAADLDKIKDRLTESLPDYMVPSTFVPMETFPLTVTGKVDRAQLARLSISEPARDSSQPITHWEREIHAIWSDVLQRRDLGCDVSFFDAGGDSIQLAIVHARVATAISRDLPITDLFAHPSIRSLAAHLEAEGSGQRDEARERALKQRHALAARNSCVIRR